MLAVVADEGGDPGGAAANEVSGFNASLSFTDEPEAMPTGAFGGISAGEVAIAQGLGAQVGSQSEGWGRALVSHLPTSNATWYDRSAIRHDFLNGTIWFQTLALSQRNNPRGNPDQVRSKPSREML